MAFRGGGEMKEKKNFFSDKEKRIKIVEKGKYKVDKHRKAIYNMASSCDDDDAFDEYIDNVNQTYDKFKRR